ncbi:MAG: asparagine synthase (glutamine-hydrolyzing) [Nitrospiraceae bacterium]|nr:MAG: asparagine synthase (glutamine-hydrolyzing) [Nitrospiraceae bacterium]
MCGIVGILNCEFAKPVEEDILKRMRDCMTHRGPDGAGIWISSNRNVGFGHRRLSIIDLSEAANQPMCNENETVWIVFNGEIYNHSEIRPELEAKGHRFRTDHSDTEVIIHAFEEWGKDCVQRFRGMFAFAIWNENTKELWFFRDRIGIKPLYFTQQQGKFIFASEIKAILKYPGIKKAVDEKAFYHYLSFMTTPCPDTLFDGIKKLSPGSYGRVKANGQIELMRYWDVFDHTRLLTGLTEQDIAEALLAELRTAVKLRKVSDVPVGIFLSGGIDSSTNAVLFAEDEKNPINTFSIGYDREYQNYQNEFKYATIIAKSVGAIHYEKCLSEGSFLDFLPKLIYHQDEPIADPVCMPVYYVSKLAREKGVTVCQVGEGSDELFCGYPSWNTFIRFQKLSNLPFTYPIKKMGLSLLALMGMQNKIRYEWLRRVTSGEPVFWGGAEAFTEGQKKNLISQRLKNKFHKFSSYEAIRPFVSSFNEKAWEKTPLKWMSYLDLNIRLPELLLMRVDKMSMAVSLEARVPFLDHKFVELAMSIPESITNKNGEEKHILKKAVSGLIPDEIINRKKQGFNVPVYEWLFEKLGDVAGKKIRAFSQRTDFFNNTSLERLIDSRNVRLWYVLNFVLWYEKWIEGSEINDQLYKG